MFCRAGLPALLAPSEVEGSVVEGPPAVLEDRELSDNCRSQTARTTCQGISMAIRFLPFQLRPSLWLALCVLPGALILASTAGFASSDAGSPHPVVVRGMVTLADGSPAVGGGICLGGRVSFWPVQDGAFEFDVENLEPGDYWLDYVKAGIAIVRVVHIAQGQREASVALRLGEHRVVEGTVVTEDLPDGAPNAEVGVRRPVISGQIFELTLDAAKDGTFQLDGLELDECSIQARVPYHRPSDWVQIRPPFPMRVKLHAQRDTVIMGRVLEGYGGKPVPGAHVAFGTKGRYGSTTADEQGHFEFTGLDPGMYRIEAYARFFSREDVILNLLEGRQVLGLEICLLKAAEHPVGGRVLGPDGKTGVPGANVSFGELHHHPPLPPGQKAGGWSGPGVPQITYSTVTREGGDYFIRLPVPPVRGDPWHPWEVDVEAEGYLSRKYMLYLDPNSAGPFDFQIFHGGQLSGVVSLPEGPRLPERTVAELQIQMGIIAPPGKLGEFGSSQSAGAPNAGAWVSPEVPVSPETGRFDFGLVQPGEHWLVVRVAGQEILRKKVTIKEGEALSVELPAPAQATH